MSAVQFDDSRLRVRDEMAKLAGAIAVLSFSSGRLANRAESPVSLRATVQLTQPQAANPRFDGHMTLALDLDKNNVAMTDLKFDVEGEGGGVKALSMAPST